VILIFLLILAWILPKVIRRLRRMFASARSFFDGRRNLPRTHEPQATP